MFKKRPDRIAFALLAAISLFNISLFASTPGEDGSAAVGGFGQFKVMGPGGGDVRVVAIDPRNADKLYVSTLDGQIYTSTDAGRNWRLLVNLNKPELVLDQLFVDSRDSQIIYASGHRNQGSGGFFKSSDGGATWKESKELSKESIHSMTQSPSDPNMLLCGTLDGVWVSHNSGDSWAKIQSATMPVNVDSLAMDPRSTNVIYAGTWWRPYKSTDEGKTWRLIKEGMIDDSDVFAVTLDPRNPDHVISSACSGIYESMNAGEKWAKIQGIPSQSRRTRDLLQHPSVPGTVYAATTEGFWMTTNGGKNWALTTQREIEVNSVAVSPDKPQRVFIGTNNYGVLVSNDGGKSFTPTNYNFTSRFTYSVTPDLQQSNRLYALTHNIATGGGFLFLSNDGGASWQDTKSWDPVRVKPFTVLQDPADPTLIYLGTNVGLYRSTDRGQSWKPIVGTPKPRVPVRRAASRSTAAHRTVRRTTVRAKAAPASTATAANAPVIVPVLSRQVRTLQFIPGQPGAMIAGTDQGVYRTTDVNKGWEKLPIGSFNDDIFAVHMAQSHPETIWVGTATSGVIVSHDAGKTWERTGGAVDNVPVSSIASDPKRPDYVYVGTVQAFYLTRDGGKTWIRRGGKLPLGDFTSILINPNNTDEVLISSALDSDGGIFLSTDAGNQWKRVDNNDMKLPSKRVWSMAFDPQDPDRIFAATHSSGVYKIERSARAAGSE